MIFVWSHAFLHIFANDARYDFMTTSFLTSFAGVVADIAVFCEFTGADLLNEDTAIGTMEQLASRLGDLNDADKAKFVAELELLSFEFERQKNG